MATAPRVRSKEQLLRVLPCMREGLSLEFKKAKNKLPSSFWQSYSAFANTQGGTIILGIEVFCSLVGVARVFVILWAPVLTLHHHPKIAWQRC